MFKTELHCHSADISGCASATAEDIVAHYTAAGYSSLVLANHLQSATMRTLGYEDYRDFISGFVKAWEKLRLIAKGKMNILFGAELRFNSNCNDYLLFGATPDFLLKHPDIFDMNPKTFSEYAREAGILFIQAHPFRDHMTIIDPKSIDGIEVFNGHIEHNSRNSIADAWADMHGLLKTSGSDFHHTTHFPNAGIITDFEIKSMDELVSTLKNGNYGLIKDESYFPKNVCKTN